MYITDDVRARVVAALNAYLAENTFWKRFISFSWDRWFNHNVGVVEDLRDALVANEDAYQDVDILNELFNQKRYPDFMEIDTVRLPANVAVSDDYRGDLKQHPERSVLHQRTLPVSRLWNTTGRAFLESVWSLFNGSPSLLSFAVNSRMPDDRIISLIEELVEKLNTDTGNTDAFAIEQNINGLAQALNVNALGDDLADYGDTQNYYSFDYKHEIFGFAPGPRYRKLGETHYANLPAVELILSRIETLSAQHRMAILTPAMNRISQTQYWGGQDRSTQIDAISQAYARARERAEVEAHSSAASASFSTPVSVPTPVSASNNRYHSFNDAAGSSPESVALHPVVAPSAPADTAFTL